MPETPSPLRVSRSVRLSRGDWRDAAPRPARGPGAIPFPVGPRARRSERGRAIAADLRPAGAVLVLLVRTGTRLEHLHGTERVMRCGRRRRRRRRRRLAAVQVPAGALDRGVESRSPIR